MRTRVDNIEKAASEIPDNGFLNPPVPYAGNLPPGSPCRFRSASEWPYPWRSDLSAWVYPDHSSSGKSFKELDWLIRSQAVTVLPSVASLKILRTGSQTSSPRKPMIAFADPVFSKASRAQTQKIAVRSITSFYRGTEVDIAGIGEYLPQLPGTRKEVKEIAAELKTPPEDSKLGLAATEASEARSVPHYLFWYPWARRWRPGIVRQGQGRARLGALNSREAQ